MDLRQSNLYANYMKSLGWVVERIDDTNIFIKKILFFAIIKIQRQNKLDLNKLKILQKKYWALFTNKEDLWHLLPTKTVIIDLQNLNIPKDTRYEIRKAVSNNLTIQQGDNVEEFYKLLQETMKLGGWQIPIKKEVTNLYYSFQPTNSVILTCGVSACLLIWTGNTAHFMYAANSKKGLEIGGAYLILNHAIKFCQKLGLKYLDLEGVYDDRYPNENKNWLGFTKFKLGWGGKIIQY